MGGKTTVTARGLVRTVVYLHPDERRALKMAAVERERRGSRQRLDVLERGLKRGENIERAADGDAIRGQLRRPQIPSIAREAQPPGGIELLFDGCHQRGDGIRSRAAERSVTLLNTRDEPLDAPHVGVAGADGRQTHHPRAERLIAPINLALRLDFAPDGDRRAIPAETPAPRYRPAGHL